MIYGPEGSIVSRDIEEERQNAPCLTRMKYWSRPKLGKRLENTTVPQDIEWAVDQNLPFPQNIFILQLGGNYLEQKNGQAGIPNKRKRSETSHDSSCKN